MGRPKKNANNKKKKKGKDNDEAEYICTIDSQTDQLKATEERQNDEDMAGDDSQNDGDRQNDDERMNEGEMNAEIDGAEKQNEEELYGDEIGADVQIEDEPEGEIELSEHALEPKRKKQRGPTKMKDIAKDPNERVKVEFTELGEMCGKGSVKLSSYLGPLVREHVPVIVEDWRKISEAVKIVLWKSVQVTRLCYLRK